MFDDVSLSLHMRNIELYNNRTDMTPYILEFGDTGNMKMILHDECYGWKVLKF